jgi:hypothetical protein
LKELNIFSVENTTRRNNTMARQQEFEDLDSSPDDDDGFTLGDDVTGNRKTEARSDKDGDDIDVAWAADDEDSGKSFGFDGDEDEESDDLALLGETADEEERKPQRPTQRERDALAREREARLAAEQRAADLEAYIAENSKASAEAIASSLDAEIAAKKKTYAEIRAEFDPARGEEEANLLLELNDLQRKKEQAIARAAAPPPTPKAVPATPKNPLVAEWREKNPWFDKKGFEAASAATRAIDSSLTEEGYNPSTREYFAELTRRLRQTVKLPNANPNNRQETMLGDTRRTAKRGNGNRVILTAQDQEFMRKLRLDPNNPEHAKDYAREKQALSRRPN